MGAASYTLSCYTVSAIPVPKGALQKPFDLQGFKLMTIADIMKYDEKSEDENPEYHGALICLPNTQPFLTSVDVIGPYEITNHKAECRRVVHLDTFMPADARGRLMSAFETYTGRKSEDVPGFWTVCASGSVFVQLHTTWSLGATGRIVNKNLEDEDFFCYGVARGDDNDGER